MKAHLGKLEAEIIALSDKDKEYLLERILISLGEKAGPSKEWAEEINRRLAEIEADPDNTIPLDEAFMRLRAGKM